jgi:hypothetical protein
VIGPLGISRNERFPPYWWTGERWRELRGRTFGKCQYELRGTLLIVGCNGMTYSSGSHDIPKHRGGRRSCVWVFFLTSGDRNYLIGEWLRFVWFRLVLYSLSSRLSNAKSAVSDDRCWKWDLRRDSRWSSLSIQAGYERSTHFNVLDDNR